jgi:hypothetical protein
MKMFEILRDRPKTFEKQGVLGIEGPDGKYIKFAEPYRNNRQEFVVAQEEPVTEVLNTPAKNVIWDYDDPENVSAKFTASNGVPYVLAIVASYIGPDEISPWTFFPNISDELEEKARFVEFIQGTGDWGSQGKQGIEGTGSAAEVFGIVINALMQYIKKFKPSMLYFQAAEPSRQRLYSAIIKRLNGVLPGWLSKQEGGHFALYNQKLFKDIKIN